MKYRSAAAAALLAPGILLGSAGAASASTPSKSLNSADIEYLQESASGIAFEVDLGKYAAAHATTPAAKHFGQLMVRDHGGRELPALKALAAREGLTLKVEPTPLQRAEIDFVKRQTGRKIDEEYASLEEEDHMADVMTQYDILREGRSAAVRSFARHFLPMYRHHLASAERTDDALEG